MLCLAYAMAESLRLYMRASLPTTAAATISLAIGFGAALSTFWGMFTTIQDSAVHEIQAFADKFLELCLQLSGAMHAYEEAFLATPILDASTAHSGDLAVLERLDHVLIGSIHMWWLHQIPSTRASFKRLLIAVQATCAALHHHAGDLGFGFFRRFYDNLEAHLAMPDSTGSIPA